jgi:DNA transformation protein
MKSTDSGVRKMKDLPNISFHMELQLINAGIPDERMLREFGARKPG